MLWKKIITWQIPVSILATVFVFTGIMHLVNPVQYASPFVHLLSGGLLLGSIFMATDYSNLADEQERNACLRRGNRNPYHGDPFVRVLPGRYVVRYPDHERIYSANQQLYQT